MMFGKLADTDTLPDAVLSILSTVPPEHPIPYFRSPEDARSKARLIPFQMYQSQIIISVIIAHHGHCQIDLGM